MPIEINMKSYESLDIYARLSRNRLRLASAVAVFTATIMALSGVGLYLLHAALDFNIDFWLLLTLFWLLCLLYVVLRYALGGRWVLKGVTTLPEWQTEPRLESALMAASLASGMDDRIRLFEIPDEDINSFSLSLPDGTFALFATRGIARKIPESERVAVMAHEIAHIQAGDTNIYTIMIRLAGHRHLKRMVKGLPGTGFDPLKSFLAIIVFAIFAILTGFFVLRLSVGDNSMSSRIAFWFLFITSLIAFVAFLPLILNVLLKVILDNEREYYADLQAVFLTRDPVAVYGAIKSAAEDVRDVLILPACFDALLFCPVIDYSSYRPFRTQPTMADRMERLKEAFPIIDI